MGIQGLLPLLKSIHKPCHLRKFAGQTVGVDAYGWLHRGTVSCAIDLAMDKPTTRYVEFAMKRVRMLIHFGVTPYLVFDGDYLPSKAKTEKERAARRSESRKLGLELLKMGKSAQAQLELQKAVDVTPEMAGLLIEELKRAGVQYVVAPYEADSQLAYLEKKGIIDAVLSEDSDLLVFGVRVLLTKLDQYGECVMIRRDDFTACREISLVGWSDADFRRMAILSGCDYLSSIDKMGLKTAYRLIRKHKSIERIVRSLQFDGKFRVPAGYLEDFCRAEMTFMYQWVYCPEAKALVNFCEPENRNDSEEMSFIGQCMEPTIAQGIASGALNPHSKMPLVLPSKTGHASIRLDARKENILPQASNQKKEKPIEAFFKPKQRIPLAELDPNLFKSSPTQQETLRRASGVSWPATPTPILQATRLSQSALSVPARRAISDAWNRTSSASAGRAVPHLSSKGRTTPGFDESSDVRYKKRPRLCDEGSSPVRSGNARVESGKSKFFPSPSRRPRSSEELWSDNSLDEALMNLPEFGTLSETPRKHKRFAIFTDADLNTTYQPVQDKETSQSTVRTTGSSIDPRQEKVPSTPVSSSGNHSPKVDADSWFVTDAVGKDVQDWELGGGEIVIPRSDPAEPPSDELPMAANDQVTGQSVSTASVLQPSNNTVVRGSEDLLFSESENEELSSPPAPAVLNLSRFAFTPR